MARTTKKFSAGGAQGRYERRMADIEKDRKIALAKGKNADVAEAKAAQRIADAKDDLAKRTGADRTATRAAEKLAESNLTKTRKYGAPKAVTQDTASPTGKVMGTLPALTAPKSGISSSSSAKPAVKKAAPRVAPRVVTQDTPKTDTPKTDFRKVRGGSNSGAPTKPLPATPFNRQAFVDLKVAAQRGKPVNSQNPVLARMRAIAESPGASRAQIQDYRRAVESGRYNKAKGGKVKKEKTMKYRSGGSTPPQPTAAERKADAKFRESIKNLKVTPEQAAAIGRGNRSEASAAKPKKYAAGGVTKEMPSAKAMGSLGMAKGGKAKAKGKPFAATKFGAALVKKSADTKGRAMVKKYASGGLVAGHKSADGCAVRGKTKGKMLASGGSCSMKKGRK